VVPENVCSFSTECVLQYKAANAAMCHTCWHLIVCRRNAASAENEQTQVGDAGNREGCQRCDEVCSHSSDDGLGR